MQFQVKSLYKYVIIYLIICWLLTEKYSGNNDKGPSLSGHFRVPLVERRYMRLWNIG